MKIRTLSLACVAAAAVLSAGCTAVYKNSDACEQMTREKLAGTFPGKLTIVHTGAGIDGTRVVVEGQFEQTPSAAASGVAAASAAAVSGRAASGATVAGAGSSRAVAGASTPAGASAPVAASTTTAAKKQKKTYKAAAAECTFSGLSLTAFRWLAPAELASPADEATE